MHIKVAHLSTVHPAHEPRILERECLSLAAEGYEVFYIVPHSQDECVKQVKILALNMPSNRWQRFFVAQFQLLKKALSTQAEIYHYHDPELLLVGIILKLKGKKVIVDVHENLPEQILHKPWIHKSIRSFLACFVGLIERLVYPCYDGIVVVVPDLMKKFSAAKTVLVRNYPDLKKSEFENAPIYAKRSNQLLYVGRIEAARGSVEMVSLLSKANPQLKVKLVLAGPCSHNHEQELRRDMKADACEMLGWASRDQVRSLLCNSKVGLCLLHPIPNYLKALPTKAFEYMVAGLPVVATDLPLLSPIIQQHQCGIIIPPYDVKAAAEAVNWLLSNPIEAEAMGKRGQEAILAHYCWATEFEKLKQLYCQIVS